MDTGAWRTTVNGATQPDMTEQLTTLSHEELFCFSTQLIFSFPFFPPETSLIYSILFFFFFLFYSTLFNMVLIH